MLALAGLAIGPTAGQAQVYGVAWDTSPDTNVTGYVVYYGTNSGSYDFRVDVGTNTMTIPPNLSPWVTYYFVVTAYNSAAVESAPSDEISFTMPATLQLNSGINPGDPMTLTFPAASGHWYEILASTDLITWTTICQTESQDSPGIFSFQDVDGAGAYQQRFYRVAQH
jgi:hypothetical protein